MRFLTGATFAVFALGLTACGSDPAPQSPGGGALEGKLEQLRQGINPETGRPPQGS